MQTNSGFPHKKVLGQSGQFWSGSLVVGGHSTLKRISLCHQVRRCSQSAWQDWRRKAFWELLRVLRIEGPPAADPVMAFDGKEAVDALQAMNTRVQFPFKTGNSQKESNAMEEVCHFCWGRQHPSVSASLTRAPPNPCCLCRQWTRGRSRSASGATSSLGGRSDERSCHTSTSSPGRPCRALVRQCCLRFATLPGMRCRLPQPFPCQLHLKFWLRRPEGPAA